MFNGVEPAITLFIMVDWNPLREDVIYFHLTGGTKGHQRNSYLKVDSVNQKVYVIHLRSEGKGRAHMREFYELKWITFISGYTHWLKYDYRMLKGHYKQIPDHRVFTYPVEERVQLLRTTENRS